MSVELMSIVFGTDKDLLPPNEKLVVLALADHANDEGMHIYPSIERIALKTSFSERNIMRMLKELRDKKVLDVVKKANAQRPTEYSINRSILEGRQSVRGDKLSSRGVTSCPKRDDNPSPYPSSNHHTETLSVSPSQESQALPPPDCAAPPSEPEDAAEQSGGTDAPPTPSKRAERKSAPAGEAAAEPRVTWLTPYILVYEKYIGVLPAEKSARALRTIEKQHGPEKTLAAWTAYCLATPPQFASAANFSSHLMQWMPRVPAQPRYVPADKKW